jgi:hypothetical protein
MLGELSERWNRAIGCTPGLVLPSEMCAADGNFWRSSTHTEYLGSIQAHPGTPGVKLWRPTATKGPARITLKISFRQNFNKIELVFN